MIITVNGPGVADMKGGVIVRMLHALTAFEQDESAETNGLGCLDHSDEEIGSPA